MSIRLTEQPKPFSIPHDLKEILTSMPLEYGTGGGVGSKLPASRFWVVTYDGTTAGYAWLAEHAGPEGPEFHINLATLPQHKKRGIADFALTSIEQILRCDHVPALHCQVNSNLPDSGQWVRLWLMRRGYELIRRGIPERYAGSNDTEVACNYPPPIYFRKVFTMHHSQP